MIDRRPLNDDQSYTEARQRSLPWESRSEAITNQSEAYKEVLKRHAGATYFGEGSFVSPEAQIFTHGFSLGALSWVASNAIIRGHVSIGANSSVNMNAHIVGPARIGDHVMIASHASIYGFNHGHQDLHRPMRDQLCTYRGVTIEDDVWIGAGAIILEGVIVAAHSIIAAGAICTKSVPQHSIVAGNPGRVIGLRGGLKALE